MGRWFGTVVIAVVLGQSGALAAVTDQQRQACQRYGNATDGMGAAIQKQKELHEGGKIGALGEDLPPDASFAARKAQRAADDVVIALQKLQNGIEDLNYQLKLCGRR